MQTMNANSSDSAAARKPLAPAVRESLERLVARAWAPLESLAMSARSKLPFSPRVAVANAENEVAVVLDVPGVEATELDVSIESSTLTIVGTRSEQREMRGRDYYRMERFRTGFERRIRLGSPIEPEKAAATLKNGVLQVRLPRAKGVNGVSHRVQVPVRAA